MQTYNFRLYRGDHFELPILVANIDLTNCQVHLHARDVNSHDYLRIQLDNQENGGITIKDNVITAVFAHDTTKHLSAGRLEYDLQITTPDDKRKTLLKGKINLIADITEV